MSPVLLHDQRSDSARPTAPLGDSEIGVSEIPKLLPIAEDFRTDFQRGVLRSHRRGLVSLKLLDLRLTGSYPETGFGEISSNPACSQFSRDFSGTRVVAQSRTNCCGPSKMQPAIDLFESDT